MAVCVFGLLVRTLAFFLPLSQQKTVLSERSAITALISNGE